MQSQYLIKVKHKYSFRGKGLSQTYSYVIRNCNIRTIPLEITFKEEALLDPNIIMEALANAVRYEINKR